jgi:hypothetical protein
MILWTQSRETLHSMMCRSDYHRDTRAPFFIYLMKSNAANGGRDAIQDICFQHERSGADSYGCDFEAERGTMT